MSNKRITDLTELTTPTTDDVFPIVDIATNTTQKVQVGNLPIQTAVTTALATKQATLVSGTNIKTVNSNSLLGSGDVAVQPTLVSGTNIKTLNSVSLLGAGDIVLAATPSGVAGAIQFSNGTAFASDATNFFWDNTNKRFGIGTNSPASPWSIVNTIALSAGATNPRIGNIAYTINNSGLQTGTATGIFLNATETALNGITHNLMDLQRDGVSRFKVDKTGNFQSGGSGIISNVLIDFGSIYPTVSNSSFSLFSDGSGLGQIALYGSTNPTTALRGNVLLNPSSLIYLKGTTSAFPAIKRNGTAIDFRLADDTAFCPVNTGVLSIQNTVATAVAVASTHKVTVVIGGTTYYLLATNV
jgi:hypothetical protein